MIIGIVLLIAVLGAAGGAVLTAWIIDRKIQGQWLPLSTKYVGVTYMPKGTDEAKLAAAIDDSIDRIAGQGPWPRAKVTATLVGLHINIMPEAAWQELTCTVNECHPTGRTVAGQTWTDLHTVQVGSGLAALTHEFCHILEWQIDRIVDYDHKGWAAKGLTALADGEAR